MDAEKKGGVVMAIKATAIIPSPKGVFLVYDKCARRFIANSWYDGESIDNILGLNKPKAKIKSLTGYDHDKKNQPR
jgi:hypothetical protein